MTKQDEVKREFAVTAGLSVMFQLEKKCFSGQLGKFLGTE